MPIIECASVMFHSLYYIQSANHLASKLDIYLLEFFISYIRNVTTAAMTTPTAFFSIESKGSWPELSIKKKKIITVLKNAFYAAALRTSKMPICMQVSIHVVFFFLFFFFFFFIKKKRGYPRVGTFHRSVSVKQQFMHS